MKKYILQFVLGPWDPNNTFRTELSSDLPQELSKIAEYCPTNEPCIFGNIEFEHFHQQLNFYNWFRGNRLRQHVRNDCGIIPCFHIFETFTFIWRVKLHLFKNKCTFQFLFIHNLDMRSLLFSWSIECEASSFFGLLGILGEIWILGIMRIIEMIIYDNTGWSKYLPWC